MMNMIARAGTAVTVSAGLLSVDMFYLSSGESGGDAKWLFRMGGTLLVFTLILGIVTWVVHRQDQLTSEYRAFTQEIRTFNKNVRARLLMDDLLNDDDPTLRALLRHEENRGR